MLPPTSRSAQEEEEAVRGERMKLQQPGLRLGIAAFRCSATRESGPAGGTDPAAASGGTRGRRGHRGPAARARYGGRRGERTKKALLRATGKQSRGLPGQMETVSLKGAEPRRRGSPRGGRGARMPRHGTPRAPRRLGCAFAGQGPRSRPGRRLPVPAARRGSIPAGGRASPPPPPPAAPASRPGPAGTCPGCLPPSRGGEPAALPAYRPVP